MRLPPIVLLLSIFIAGCTYTEPIPPPLPKDIQARFHPGIESATETITLTNALENVEKIEIYLDASQSMRGYIGSGGAEAEQYDYMKILQNLFSASQSIAPIHFFKFGSTISPIEGSIRNLIRSTNFYSEIHTRLETLIESFLDREPEKTMFMIVTDGVQSDKGNNLIRITEAVNGWVEAGYAMEILGFRSEFHGTIFSEIILNPDPRHRIQYDSVSSDPSTFRPFYLYVFAPKTEQLSVINRISKQYGLNAEVFNPSAPLVRTTKIQNALLAFHDPQHPPLLDTYMTDSFKIEDELIHLEYIYWKDTPGMRKEEMYPLQIDYQPHPENSLNLRNSDHLRPRIRGTYFFANQWESIDQSYYPGDPVIESKPSVSPNANSFTILFPMKRPQQAGWFVYQCELYPELGSLDPPAWVTEWSTEWDADPANGNKTLNFSKLAISIINKVTINQRLFLFYLIAGVNI